MKSETKLKDLYYLLKHEDYMFLKINQKIEARNNYLTGLNYIK